MAETSVLLTPPLRPRDCDPVTCAFTVSMVRAYLICWRQARIYREPFPDVLRNRFRNSRCTDAGIRGTRFDPLNAVDTGIALQQAQQAGLSLEAWNAEAVAKWLCSNEHVEPVVDE